MQDVITEALSAAEIIWMPTSRHANVFWRARIALASLEVTGGL